MDSSAQQAEQQHGNGEQQKPAELTSSLLLVCVGLW